MSDEKIQKILAAAKKCFLQFGYRKTTLEDVAKEALIARSTIYVYFKNKEELFVSWVESTLEQVHKEAKTIASSDLSREEKLYQIFEAWKLKPLKPIFDSQYGTELFEQGHSLLKDVLDEHKKKFQKLITPLVGGKDIAEVLVLGTHGISCNSPSYDVLKKHIYRLIDIVLGKHLEQTVEM